MNKAINLILFGLYIHALIQELIITNGYLDLLYYKVYNGIQPTLR